MRMQGTHAREKRIDDPKCVLVAVLFRDPSRFVSLYVVREMAAAGQEAGVVSSSEHLGSDVRRVSQEPNFLARAYGDGSGFDGNTHRALELVESQCESSVAGRNNHKVSRLIRGN